MPPGIRIEILPDDLRREMLVERRTVHLVR
jgi:hypothetical protein